MTRTEIPENRIICKHVNTQNDYRIRKKRKDVRDYEEKKNPNTQDLLCWSSIAGHDSCP